MLSTTSRKQTAKDAVDQTIRNALSLAADSDCDARDASERLLLHVRRRASLLRPPRAGGLTTR